MEKKLSERKQKILKAVVDEYIKSAMPISSGEIKSKYFDDVCSATIRSELSTLEDMGYLIKPHTSAGRIPSPSAYKLYASSLLENNTLATEEIAIIDRCFKSRFMEVEDIVKNTAKVISDVTNYTSVIVLHNINEVIIKEIKLVGLDEHSALVIIITDSGIIRDKVIHLNNEINPTYLTDAILLLNKVFCGKMVEQLTDCQTLLDNEFNRFKELFDNILVILKSYNNKDEVFIEGTSKFLDHPDSNLETAKNFLSLIDNKDTFSQLIDENKDIEFSIKIGKDESGIDKCSIVSVKYKFKGNEVGHAGVIGPMRMDYNKVVSVLNYIGKTVSIIANEQNNKEKLIDNGKKEKSRKWEFGNWKYC